LRPPSRVAKNSNGDLVYVLSGPGTKKKKEKNIVCTQTAGISAGYVVPAV
jgi:hypothetical protein